MACSDQQDRHPGLANGQDQIAQRIRFGVVQSGGPLHRDRARKLDAALQPIGQTPCPVLRELRQPAERKRLFGPPP